MEELLNESKRNIELQTKLNSINTYEKVLNESIEEIKIAKDLVKKFSDIRNTSIINLYGVGVSARKISDLTGLSTVFIHRIVKGK